LISWITLLLLTRRSYQSSSCFIFGYFWGDIFISQILVSKISKVKCPSMACMHMCLFHLRSDPSWQLACVVCLTLILSQLYILHSNQCDKAKKMYGIDIKCDLSCMICLGRFKAWATTFSFLGFCASLFCFTLFLPCSVYVIKVTECWA